VIAKTSDLMYRLNVQVTAYGRQTVLDKVKILGTPIVSLTGTIERKVIKFCARVTYIDRRNRMTYHPQNGRGYGHVAVLKFCHLPWCIIYRTKKSAASQAVATVRIVPKICQGKPRVLQVSSKSVHFQARQSYSRTREHRQIAP